MPKPQTFKQKHPVTTNILILLVVILFAAFAYSAIKVAQESNGNLISPVIVVIPVKGEIGIGGAADSTEIVKQIKKADKDLTVSAIILEINSPGGTVVASEEIAAAVKETNKPTVAWIREVGASGAYWIASAADKIVADPASITGSIGVTGSYLQFSRLMETYGVTYERLVSGKFKDTGSQFKELSPEERSYLQAKIDAINGLFIDTISANRNLPRESVAQLATGEIFLGTEAKNLGLIDVLGGKAEAQKTAEQLAGIKNSRLVSVEEQRISLLDLLTQQAHATAYWIGKGIGDSWNPLNGANEDLVLKAELN